MGIGWAGWHAGTAPVFPQLAQFTGKPRHRRRQLGHWTPQLTQRHMVVGADPRPQLDRLTSIDAEEPLEVGADLQARPPQLRSRWRKLGQHMRAHPTAGPFRVEFSGYAVVFAAVLGHYPDGDQVDGAAVFDELRVVEIPHLPNPSPRLRGRAGFLRVVGRRAPRGPVPRRPCRRRAAAAYRQPCSAATV